MKFLKLLFILVYLFFVTASYCFANNKTTQTVLPLELSAQGMPSVNIQMQGKVIPVIFDTGDSKGAITLSQLALKNLQVKFTGKQTCMSTTSGKVCQKNFVIPEVNLGDLALHDVDGTLMNELWGGGKGFIETAASKNGVIGLKALENFGVLIDYPHSQIILSKNYKVPKGYDVNTWVQIPFEIKYGINTKSAIDGVPVSLAWDTGPNFSILKPIVKLNDKVISCSQNSNCPSDFPKGSNKAFKTNKFTFNGQKIANTWFEVADAPFPFDGLIASNFFKHNIVFIDFKNKILFVKNYE